ncbi:MAG: beta-lactamase family protein [Kiritimatiellae bacterium]|nr:beta-lactamase family protein [Kiritimatiellia bacterium]
MDFPNGDWKKDTPANQGVDSAKLEQAMQYLDENMGAAETALVRNGVLIWEGAESNAFHQIFSCTKTFTTTVLGLLIGDGRCALDDRAVDHYPELAADYPEYTKITMRHLATMTSGYTGERGPENPELPWGDPNFYIRPKAPMFEAGTRYDYHDPNVYMLGYILTKLAGKTLEDVIRERIAEPIGMKRFEWRALPGAPSVDGITLVNPPGSPYPVDGGGVYTTPRDFARYGLLFLNNGNWNGRQLLDSGWPALAGSTQVPNTLPGRPAYIPGRYGFLWWTNGEDCSGNRPWPAAPPRTYSPHGAGRNFCFVIPEWNLVFARMAPALPIPHFEKKKIRPDPIFNRFFEILGAGIRR